MIKFFRKIRQRLLTENKFTKYLLYAIGEIVLVVIGILIALSINNWNQNRMLQLKTHTYLSEIINDLKADTSAFSVGIRHYNKKIATNQPKLFKTDFSNSSIEELEKLIVLQYYAYRIVDNSHQKIRSSGFTNLQELDTIFRSINKYYSELQDWHNQLVNYEIQGVNEQSDYWFLEQEIYEISNKNNFPVIQNAFERKANLIRLLTTPKGRNYLYSDYERKQRMAKHYKEMFEDASALIQEIENELAAVNKY